MASFNTTVTAELEQDLIEVDRLVQQCQRQRIIDLLVSQRNQIQQEIAKHKIQPNTPLASLQPDKPKVVVKSKNTIVNLTTYAWDQSDKFVKIYLTNLNGVQDLAPENVILSSEEGNSRHHVTIQDLKGKTYKFQVPNLLHPVEAGTFKLKENMLLLMFKKKSFEKWEVLSEVEKIKKDLEKEKMPKADDMEKEDPSASIMNMMQKMYQEGDDNMKRTIAKAWTEAREKKDVPM